MTPQEQELLTYLEDLQQNNPAEYEMLVKELNEKRAAEGKGPATAQQQGEQVVPTPGFVAKTRSATRKGAKVFINVCSSDHVDKPAPVDSDTNAEEVQMRIPMSLGPPREDLDKNGEVCTVYDVVFHPDAVEGALGEAEFRSFVMQLTVHQVQQKYQDELSTDMTFPKVKGNYKGIAPLPQIMRKKGVPPPPPPGSAEAQAQAEAEAKAKAEAHKPLVEEIAAPSAESLPAPSYAVDPRKVGAGGEEGLSLKVHLPQVDDVSDVELRMSTESVELLVPSVCALSLQLPRTVQMPPLSANFDAERKVLSLLLRADNAGSLDAGVHEAAPDADEATGEVGKAALPDDEVARREREREARLNAKRRRAAGNKQLKADAEAAEAVATAGEAAEEEATGGAPAAEEEVAAAEAAVDETAALAERGGSAKSKKDKEKDLGLIEITNSIIMELEE